LQKPQHNPQSPNARRRIAACTAQTVVIHYPLAGKVIGCAIEVHRALGPGLLEVTYEECLDSELKRRGIAFARQVPLPATYKDAKIDCAYRLDFLVEGALIVEVKAVEKVAPVHHAQVLTYLKLLKVKQGLLINFNVPVLVRGVKSFLL
jgi:GxxExxY protein